VRRHLTTAATVFLVLLIIPAGIVPSDTGEVTEEFTFFNTTYTLRVEPEYTAGGYDRNRWPHWASIPGTCFTVRDKALAEESWVPVKTVPAAGGRCRVVEGLWRDPYTGREFTDAADVDVDHVVPLAEAYESGGHRWGEDRRRDYANELAHEDHLFIVYDRENQGAKGKGDPAEYLPPNHAFVCDYLEAWVRIKARWDLSVDPEEVEAIREAMFEFMCE
jgi:hypothetical protein